MLLRIPVSVHIISLNKQPVLPIEDLIFLLSSKPHTKYFLEYFAALFFNISIKTSILSWL